MAIPQSLVGRFGVIGAGPTVTVGEEAAHSAARRFAAGLFETIRNWLPT